MDGSDVELSDETLDSASSRPSIIDAGAEHTAPVEMPGEPSNNLEMVFPVLEQEGVNNNNLASLHVLTDTRAIFHDNATIVQFKKPLSSKIQLLTALFNELDLDEKYKAEFVNTFSLLTEQYKKKIAAQELEGKEPERDYQPHKESIVDYILSKAGYGPWYEAGLLTKAFIRNHSNSAYDALNNWVKNKPLPSGMVIPTKSQSTKESAELAMAAFPMSHVARVNSSASKRQNRTVAAE